MSERGADWLRELWADPKLRDTQRTYVGFEPGQDWSGWGDVKRLAEERSIRLYGRGPKARAHTALEQAGFAPAAAARAVKAVGTFTLGYALTETGNPSEGPALPDEDFEYGLGALLDGIARRPT